MDGSPRCENCDEILRGTFCHRCGQQAGRPPDGAIPFMLQQISALVGLDSKTLRSISGLLFRPGHLTREFSHGRRVAYTAPLQLYLATAAGFFLVQIFKPLVSLDLEQWRISAFLASVGSFRTLPDDLMDRLGEVGMSPDVFAARFDAAVTGYLPVLLLLLVVAFAAWLKLLFRRHPFSLHATFSLHWSAFYLILEGLKRLTPVPSAINLAVIIGMSVVSLLYLTLALRTAYGSGWIVSSVKAFASLLLYYALIVMWFTSTVTLAIRLV